MKIFELQKEGTEQLKKVQITEARRKVNGILSHLTGLDAVQLRIHEQEEISEKQRNDFFTFLDKLIQGYPLQYITGKQEFMRVRISCDRRRFNSTTRYRNFSWRSIKKNT